MAKMITTVQQDLEHQLGALHFENTVLRYGIQELEREIEKLRNSLKDDGPTDD